MGSCYAILIVPCTFFFFSFLLKKIKNIIVAAIEIELIFNSKSHVSRLVSFVYLSWQTKFVIDFQYSEYNRQSIRYFHDVLVRLPSTTELLLRHRSGKNLITCYCCCCCCLLSLFLFHFSLCSTNAMVLLSSCLPST